MKTTVRMELCRQVADWSHCALEHPDFWGPGGREGRRYIWKGEKQDCGRRRSTPLRISGDVEPEPALTRNFSSPRSGV